MLVDRPMKKTRGIRIEVPLDVHKRLKYLKDERKYAGLNETIAEVATALIKLGLDTIEERAKALPQTKIFNEEKVAV